MLQRTWRISGISWRQGDNGCRWAYSLPAQQESLFTGRRVRMESDAQLIGTGGHRIRNVCTTELAQLH